MNRFYRPIIAGMLALLATIVIGSPSIAQRITSPGLTKPSATPSNPTPTPTNVPRPTPSPVTVPPPPPSPTPTATPIPKVTPKPTATPIPTVTPTPSVVPIPVPPPKSSPSPTVTPRPTTPTPAPQGAIDRSGTTLSPTDRERMAAYLRARNINVTSAIAPSSPRFILHDTSVILSSAQLDREARIGRGPLGLGVNVFVPRSNGGVLTRPNFYEPRRPTTTEFEKASDVLTRAQRESLMRQVWQATKANGRQWGLSAGLSNLGLSPSEIAKEQQGAVRQLTSSDRVYTAATWTTESICNRYLQGDGSISINDPKMSSACNRLRGYFATRNERVKSSVAVEIIQVGARSERGNQNTCDPRNSNIATLPSPVYSDTQYQNTIAAYFRAALMANKFPETTTHFKLDARLPESHCDPRCFNLGRMYNSIATILGHPRGTRYGITPSYGTRGGTNNIWWDNRICRGTPN